MRRYSIPFLLLLIPLILATASLYNDLITAKVVKVADGDSITVLASGNKKVKIRLHGIDCPERLVEGCGLIRTRLRPGNGGVRNVIGHDFFNLQKEVGQ